MEGLFIVKDVIPLESFQGSDGQTVSKKQIVLASREPRVGESGIYTQDQDFVAEVIGEAADQWYAGVNALIAATINFSASKYNDRYFQNCRIIRAVVI